MRRDSSFGYTKRYRETPGSNDHNDPAWLLENVSIDEIERVLSTLKPLANVTTLCSTTTHRLFSDWEIDFIDSVNNSYEQKHVRGFHDRPLTGKQLFWIWKLYERVAADAESMLMRDNP